MLISTALAAAADKLEPKGAWGGLDCAGPDCAQTAIDFVAGFDNADDAQKYLAAELGWQDRGADASYLTFIWNWNDAPERTQSEVVSKLREAAAKARSEGK